MFDAGSFAFSPNAGHVHALLSPLVVAVTRRHSGVCPLVVLVVTLLYSTGASATRVTIRISSVSGDGGVMRVALCLQAEWGTHHCSFGEQKAATAGTDELSVDVPPGIYGIMVHHDANGDGEVNKNLFGRPLEGVGFSRNANVRFGFPEFSSVSLPISGDAVSTSVSLVLEPAEKHP